MSAEGSAASFLSDGQMNIVQELDDHDMYCYDLLVCVTNNQFDLTSHVTPFCLKFHC